MTTPKGRLHRCSARTVEEKPVPSRADQIKRLASGEEFDVLVVGGGATGLESSGILEASRCSTRFKSTVTGAGVALEAQLRGLKVACVEQERRGLLEWLGTCGTIWEIQMTNS